MLCRQRLHTRQESVAKNCWDAAFPLFYCVTDPCKVMMRVVVKELNLLGQAYLRLCQSSGYQRLLYPPEGLGMR
jgi:hypothetical protein